MTYPIPGFEGHDDPEPSMIDLAGATANFERVPHTNKAVSALLRYSIVGGLASEPIEQTMVDLITDLHHLADALQFDWDSIRDGAEMHHNGEVE